MIDEMNSLVAKIQLPESQVANESLLEEDEEVLEPTYHEDEESDGEPIEDFNEKEDFKLAQTLEKALELPTSSSFKSTFHI